MNFFKIKFFKKLIFIIFSIMLIFTFLYQSYIKIYLAKPVELVSDKFESIRLPIIMYHSIMKNKRSLGKFVVSPDELESDLKYLKDNNYNTIFMKDVLDYVYENKDVPDNPIILTFDDGYYNNYLYAYPLIKNYESKIVLSPIGIEIDRYSNLDEHSPSYAHMTWDNLKEMSDSGLVEIQNHSYNMHKLNKKRRGTKKNKNESFEKYKFDLTEDLSLMQRKLKNNLNVEANTFVYPFGAMSNCSVEIIKELGFKASFGCEGKINLIDKNPEKLYGLCRIIRQSGISSEKFFKLILSDKLKNCK